jgi:hypothetical protein
MTTVDLVQFASLFEIGFALHFAVAFIDRIYAKELPVRIDRIAARAEAVERLEKEIAAAAATGGESVLRFPYRIIEQPVWAKHNEHVLDQILALLQETKGQVRALKRILSAITFCSFIVVLYSVTMLFLIGLGAELARDLEPMTASAIVLMQLLPLPVAAAAFFFVARRMSQEVDRKIRGVGELQLILSDNDGNSISGDASVDQVFQRDRDRNGINKDI